MQSINIDDRIRSKICLNGYYKHNPYSQEGRRKHKERNRTYKNDPNQKAGDKQYNFLYENYTRLA